MLGVTWLTQDAAYCIYRVPPPVVLPNTSHLAAKHPPHVPAYLRSSKLPVPKSHVVLRINELMAELGVETQRLVMPTRNNLEALDGVLVAGAALCDMKRQVDRVEQELRTLRAQREGYVAPLHSRGV
jgi:DNA methyltransferase 1-associated protein 1